MCCRSGDVCSGASGPRPGGWLPLLLWRTTGRRLVTRGPSSLQRCKDCGFATVSRDDIHMETLTRDLPRRRSSETNMTPCRRPLTSGRKEPTEIPYPVTSGWYAICCMAIIAFVCPQSLWWIERMLCCSYDRFALSTFFIFGEELSPSSQLTPLSFPFVDMPNYSKEMLVPFLYKYSLAEVLAWP